MQQKFSLVSILIFACLAASGCSYLNSKSGAQSGNAGTSNKNSAAARQSSKDYREPKPIATIAVAEVTESSGIAASPKNKEIFWTHNDSGAAPVLYAFDRTGKKRGAWRVTGAKNVDWEDMASYADRQTGESFLFIGDIGDNRKKRGETIVYRVREPEIKAGEPDAGETERADAIRLRYPDSPRDAETLMINPQNGDLYILSKNFEGGANIYKLSQPFDLDKTNTLERLGAINVPSVAPGLLTGGAIAPSGTRVVLTDYLAAYELVLPAEAKSFDEIWKQTPAVVELGERAQGEAVCYSRDERAIIATSEKKNSPLIEVERK